MKFYIHYEGDPDFTYIAKCDDPKGTIKQLKIKFATAYNKKFGSTKTLDPNNLVITNKKIQYKDDDIVIERIKEKEDVFAIEDKGLKSADQLALIAQQLKEEGNNYMNEKNYEKAVQKYTEAILLDPTCITIYSNRSQGYLFLGKYREAVIDADKVIHLDHNNPKAYFRKGNALYKNRQFSDALACFSTALTLPKLDDKSKRLFNDWISRCRIEIDKERAAHIANITSGQYISGQNVTENSDKEEVRSYVDKAHKLASQAERNKNFKQASAFFEQILAVSPFDKTSLLHLGNIWFNAKKWDKAVYYYSQGHTAYPTDYLFACKLGESFFEKKDFAEASKYYASALEHLSGDERTENDIRVKVGETLYAAGSQGTAVQIWRNIIENKDDNHYGALFAYAIALKEHSGVADALPVFLRLLVKDTENPKVREQLAEIVKSPGGYEAMKNELSQIPQSASALSYLAMIVKDYGALEGSYKLYKEAFDLHPQSASYALNIVHVLEILNRYDEAFLFIQKFCHDNSDIGVGQLTCAHIYNVIKGRSSILAKPDPDVPDLPTQNRPSIPLEANYPPDELDLLALLCTLVKILYIIGNLELIPILSSIINPVRHGRPMHTTTIRNEHAYFCCIDQLMPFHLTPINWDLPKLYLSGDSHALSSAWQTINFKGQIHLIKPLLVTGLKCWHLREESHFYPKYNFWNIVPNAPRGSYVIFQFGEIDCREGLVIATQKCIYEDIAEGARVAIDIYIKVLLEVKSKYGYTIYVHPPAPVIDVTRDIVKTFTRILKQRVLETEGLYWLNFEEQLLSPDKTKLNPDFELDGTHLSPKYLYLLENALKEITDNNKDDNKIMDITSD